MNTSGRGHSRIVLPVLCAVFGAAGAVASAEESPKPWTPETSVEIRSFTSESIHPTEDGTKFFFVTWQADPACNCSTYELDVFLTEDVRQALQRKTRSDSFHVSPAKVLIRKAYGNDSTAIAAPGWDAGGQSISFQGPDEKGITQYYRYDLATGSTTALTSAIYPSLSMVRAGNVFVSTALVPKAERFDAAPVHSIATQEFLDSTDYGESVRLGTWIMEGRNQPWEVSTGIPPGSFDASVSPAGHWAIVIQRPTVRPQAWDQYELSKFPSGRLEFVLVDIKGHHSAPIFGTPVGLATRAGGNLPPTVLWSQDERHAIIVNTTLPAAAKDAPEQARMAYVVDFEPAARRWSVLEPIERKGQGTESEHVARTGWLVPGKELLITHKSGKRAVDGTVYTLTGGKWVAKAVPSTVSLSSLSTKQNPLRGGISASVRQGENDPPMMVASDGKSLVALTSVDPALTNTWWARQRAYRWKEPSGRIETGGLLLPRGVDIGQRPRLPLVIQAYTYAPKRFEPDGPFEQTGSGAYAGQSLVAHGFAVLNINIPSEDTSDNGTLEELREFTSRIESAVDTLAENGIVDAARIGLIGFSRAGFLIHYAITHPGTRRIAAAVIDDSFPGTYAYYLSLAAIGSNPGGYDLMYGGSFWNRKESWLANEPSFSVDRVQTPVLFTVHRESSIPFMLDTVGAFRLNNKPFDIYLFPNGSHLLRAPRQRVASKELSVDWLRFWLQGSEDNDPSKAEEYDRWKRIRDVWDNPG